MARRERPQDTLAVVFDFDDTLAPDSTGRLLESLGVDEESFWATQHRRVREGWGPVPAQLFELSRSGRTRGGPITRERLARLGAGLEFFQGVPELFDRLRELSQFIYVGDGFTDVPCFAQVQERNGIAIGVYKRGARHERRNASSVRLAGLAPVDYRRGEQLSESLLLAVGSLCQRVAHRARRSAEPPRDNPTEEKENP